MPSYGGVVALALVARFWGDICLQIHSGCFFEKHIVSGHAGKFCKTGQLTFLGLVQGERVDVLELQKGIERSLITMPLDLPKCGVFQLLVGEIKFSCSSVLQHLRWLRCIPPRRV